MEINVENLADNLLNKVTGQVNELASTETILGEEFTIGEFTCRPVIKVGTGFGTGAGKGEKSRKGHGTGAGAAGGIGIAPVGFLVVKGGEISFIPASNKKGLSAVFEKVPDLIEKIMEMKAKEKEREEEKQEKKAK